MEIAMGLEWFMILLGWFSAVAFVAIAGYRIAKIARMPLSLRWEVYPVPHESKEKRAHGGSYMEEVDWTKDHTSGSPIPGWIEIGTEVLALKKVKEHNPYGIWPFSLAMHWGIYLYFGWIALLVVGNLVSLPAISFLTSVVGPVAFILGALGSIALIIKRRTTQELRLYTTPLDYFNLAFLASYFVMGLVSWSRSFSSDAHHAYIASVLFFIPTHLPLTVTLSFLLFELFMIYMPFTKLIHYFAKYFTFHHVLWDDAFKAKGSAIDRKVIEQLGYPVNWSASHILRGKSWLEQAQTTATESDKK
jgi:nitrate reductase gamma subunit